MAAFGSGVVAAIVCAFWTVAESTRRGVPAPFEDAAMLFRYAENFANGAGITWNSGQDPGLSDGATDVGFVLVLAPLHYFGLSCAAAALLVNAIAIFGIGTLFGVLNHRLWQRPVWLPLAGAALVAAGPVNRYVLGGFSAPAMAFLLLAAFTLAAVGPSVESHRKALLVLAAAGVVAGISGWWRPEGFALGPLGVLVALVLVRRVSLHCSTSARAVASVLAPFGLLAAGWIAFRISYFGHLLPTSAIMKMGSLHPDNAVQSLQFCASLLLPLIGILVVRALGQGTPRNWWLSAGLLTGSLVWLNGAIPREPWTDFGLSFVPVVADFATMALFVPLLLALIGLGVRRRDGSWLFPLALAAFSIGWVAIAPALNWWGRMQWPVVPVLTALALALLTAVNMQEAPLIYTGARARRSVAAVLALLVCLGVLTFHLPAGGYYESPFQTDVASALKTVDTSNVRIATTEAGLIPLAVTGQVLDTFGHNNRSIAASDGASLPHELDSFRPNILAVHGLPPYGVHIEDCSTRQQATDGVFSARWSTMVSDIYRYAAGHGFALSRLSETRPCEAWSLWLSDEVDTKVRHAISQLSMPGTEMRVSEPPIPR